MRTALALAFKGSHYHGWQAQPNAHTVQAELQAALAKILNQPTECVGCGRTDTGVHAVRFVAHFDTETAPRADLHHRLTALLPQDIVVYGSAPVIPDFHARFSAVSRSYRYTIVAKPDPFAADMAWLCRQPLDVEAMNAAAALLWQHTNFECFSKVHTDVSNFNCTISKAEWRQNGNKLEFHITANRFLRNMVRAIVGTLADVGRGKSSLTDVEGILASRNRSQAGESVPAKGLSLVDVVYPEGFLPVGF